MQELPEARELTRRALLFATLGAGCVRAPEASLADFRTFMSALPRQTAGVVPFEPRALEGKVVLVTFVATWCFPCLTELVVLQRLERDHAARGFANVLVGMDLEGRAVLDPFVEGYKITSPLVVADDRLRAGETVFGRIRELPSRVLFARSGEVVVGFAGLSRYEDLDALVVRELDKR